MIQSVIKILKVLNSETHPAQISLGLCFSVIVAFTPKFSLHNIVIYFLILFGSRNMLIKPRRIEKLRKPCGQ